MRIIAEDIERILVINLGSVSETLLAAPVTRALKKCFPDAFIAVLTTPAAAAAVEMDTYADAALLYDKRGEQQGILGMLGTVNMLRRENFDLAVCLNESVRGALAAWAAGIRWRLGYDRNFAKIFLTHAAAVDQERILHRTISQMAVLEPLALAGEDTGLELSLDEKAEKIFDTTIFIENERPNVAFCPLNTEHPRCNPSKKKSVEIIRRLETFADVYLIGGRNEMEELEALAAQAALEPARILAGRLNLKEAAVLLAHMDAMVSVTAAPMYIAQALRVPIVALFGPADPRIYGPCGNRDVALTYPVECAPCTAQVSCAGNCCVENISVDEIEKKVRERVFAPEGTAEKNI